MKQTSSIAVLGSTGSIGRQTLEVACHLGLRVDALAARRNDTLMEIQARAFSPKMVAMADKEAAGRLKIALADTDIRVYSGEDAAACVAESSSADTAVTAMEGLSGLSPTYAAISSGKKIALANKETLVCAGRLIFAHARKMKSDIVPVDSEHAAIAQSLASAGTSTKSLSRILLTASGGPFFGKNAEELARVTPEDALRHPNWNMGHKITIDSATMMNKGLELIEAMHLFSCAPEQICVLIHRESIVHSMVEFTDGTVIGQMGVPDMRLPIQYALTWPERRHSLCAPVDFFSAGALHFAEPDDVNFPCLPLARRVASLPNSAAVVMNAANEISVAAFLDRSISFPEIAEINYRAVEEHSAFECRDLNEILSLDHAARIRAAELVASARKVG